MAVFRDHFSGHAEEYARWRPVYPRELFAWLLSLTGHDLAWDCATGNGQAAAGLAPHFRHVVATDASLDQLARATPHASVSYCRAEASRAPLRSGLVDLVTVAQALHWFDIAPFVAEVRRVVRPGGALVAWTYDLFRVERRIDERVDEFAETTVGPFWPPERRHVDSGYATLDLGLEPIAAPAFAMRERWSLDQVLGYIGTWSAVGRFRRARGVDPVADLAAALEPLWGPRQTTRELSWSLSILAGRL